MEQQMHQAGRRGGALPVLVGTLGMACLCAVAGTGTLNDYNPYDVSIPDNGSSVNTDLGLSGAPGGAVITKVKVYYEIVHPRPSDLDVWLTCYDGGWQADCFLHTQGSPASVDRITVDNIHTWDGGSPNVTWYLACRDRVSGSVGYIAFFELWVTYSVNDPPGTPSSEDPSDGATGVSSSKDLDWACSDPNSDTLYYTVYFEKGDSSPDTAIRTDATGSAADPGTLDFSSHYYWQVKADDHRGGATWGPVWDFYTEPAPVVAALVTGVSFDRAQVKRGVQAIVATVTLSNTGNQAWTFHVGGSAIKSGDTTWYDWTPSRATVSLNPGDSGTVQLAWSTPAGAPLGTYGFFCKAFKYSTGDEFADDDWRASAFEVIDPVNAGQIASVSFDKFSVVRGLDTITATVAIQNTGDQSYTFYLGGSSIEEGGTAWYDWAPSRASRTISAGSTGTVAVSWACPPGAPPGSYGFYSKLFKADSGSAFFDDDWHDAAFQVEDAPLAVHGRVAYHSYSGYMAVPADSVDGNVFVYRIDGNDLANLTEALAIDNSMNPHFSPDGSCLTFMAVPFGAARDRSSLEVYVYDLAEAQLSRLTSNAVPDEDPKFSPDGLSVVWKRDGQVWRMRRDGGARTQLTSTGVERSGPNYSPDGDQIVYWSGSGQSADIWRMDADGSGARVLVATADLQEYYPIYRDSSNVLYSRWESASDHHDKVYNVDVSSGVSTRLAANVTGAEDADASPVDSTYLLLSSDRAGGKGGYDVLFARYDNGGTHTLGDGNSAHNDLGACYSRYTYARRARAHAPTAGASLTAGAPYTLQVRAYSDGGAWAGASPSVSFQGPGSQTYSDLRDDGTAGDAVAGDGIYSRTVALPAVSGSYTVTASAQSVEPGVTRELVSAQIAVTLVPPNSPPTGITLSPSAVPENRPAGTDVGTLSTTDPDPGNTFTYTLATGDGSTDNAAFTISGGTLRTSLPLNYEAKSSYSIRVRTTDQGGLWCEEAFAITVQNVNEVPAAVVLSCSTVAENQAPGTVVGTLSAIDPDVGNTFTYALVDGAGATGNAYFTVGASTLYTATPFDREATSSYSVRVRATDQGGLWCDQVLTVAVQDVNEAPADIVLSNTTVTENGPSGTVVGTLSATDPDVGNTFTYALVDGAGAADNSCFTVDGSTLYAAVPLDYEAKSSCSVRVRATDQGGLWHEVAVAITVLNTNEAPTDLALSGTSVAENEPIGTVVGALGTTDPDTGGVHAYTLVSGPGGDDNGCFTISANVLAAGASFNYEARSAYSVRVRTTDQGGLWCERAFTITVLNVNEAPTDLALSTASVPENQPAGTAVGVLVATEEDVGNTPSYALVDGAGAAGNASFAIGGSILYTATPFDYEVRSSYGVRVRVTDPGGLWYEEAFTIAVGNVNEAPTAIALSNASVPENQPSGAVVGTLSTSDPDAGNTFTYALVDGAGAADNASFTIGGGVFCTATSFDYEVRSSCGVRVRATDQGGLWYEEAFTITVGNVNEAPTAIVLSNASVSENQPSGTAVGTLSTSDPDAGNTFTYALVDGTGAADNASFSVGGSTLRTATPLDYEAQTGCSVRVRATDQGGLWYEKAFAVTVVAVNEEAPVLDLDPDSNAQDLGFRVTHPVGGGPVRTTGLSGPLLADADSPDLASATVSILPPLDGEYESLAVTDGDPSVTSVYDPASSVLLLRGRASIASYRALIGSVVYENISPHPSAAPHEIAFVVSDGDLVSARATCTVFFTDDTTTLRLEQGWNLLSVPFDTAPWVAVMTLLCDADGRSLVRGCAWGWVAGAGAYQPMGKGAAAEQGLWAYRHDGPTRAVAAETALIAGRLRDGLLRLQQGWNLFGPVVDIPVSVVRDLPETGGPVWYWDGPANCYGAVGATDELRRGTGYWLYATQGTEVYLLPQRPRQ